MEQREMNFFDLCVAFAHVVAKGFKALWQLLLRMVRISYQLWWVVIPCVLICVAAALYYSRPTNLKYRVNAVALLNGISIQQFEQSFAMLSLVNQMPKDATITPYIKEKTVTNFKLYKVIDCMHDGTADFIDYDDNSSPTDTLSVQMQDRIAMQFCIKDCNLSLLPDIESGMMQFLNDNSIFQNTYNTYINNLKNKVAFNHSQAVKLDSLTTQYYFNNNFLNKKMAGVGNGVTFVSDWRVDLFLDDIYDQQEQLQIDDNRLQLATAPVALENHFVVDSKPLNSRNKCIVIFFLLGWIGGCVLATLIRYRQSIFAWLKQ